MHDQAEVFEGIVKKHVDAGMVVSTAIGWAIEEDPEAYGEYLKRQQQVRIERAMERFYSKQLEVKRRRRNHPQS